MKNKRGFTLIELLAVIVILGIILVIAIPSISAAILNSRKNAYVATANEFVDGLRMMTLTDASLLPTDGSKECKALTAIKLEKGSNTKSPFGKKYTSDSKVCVKYDTDKRNYTYSVCLVDEGGNGLSSTDVLNLDKKDVKLGNFYCNLDGTGGTGDSGNNGGTGEDDANSNEQISAGLEHTLALKSDGTVLAWGSNVGGQLGDGTKVDKYIPTGVLDLNRVIQISAGHNHSLALLADETVKSWGYNGYGQLGNITTLDGVIQISAGKDHSMALLTDGTVKSWGYNDNGELGNGKRTNTNTPQDVLNLTGVKQISAAWDHSLALLNDGTVYAWGSNEYKQLGNTSVNQRSTIPVLVEGLTDIVQVSAGTFYSVALDKNGNVYAWGRSSYCCFGSYNTPDRAIPLQIESLSNVTQIAASYSHYVALLNNGSVKIIGSNYSGEYGNGGTQSILEPSLVPDFTNVKQVVSGSSYIVALKEDGTVWTWGKNNRGQLGDGTTNTRLYPVEIISLRN